MDRWCSLALSVNRLLGLLLGQGTEWRISRRRCLRTSLGDNRTDEFEMQWLRKAFFEVSNLKIWVNISKTSLVLIAVAWAFRSSGGWLQALLVELLTKMQTNTYVSKCATVQLSCLTGFDPHSSIKVSCRWGIRKLVLILLLLSHKHKQWLNHEQQHKTKPNYTNIKTKQQHKQ